MFHSIGLNFWPEGIKHPACKFSTSHRMNLHQLRIIWRDMLTGNLQQLIFSPPWKEPAPEGTGTGGVSKGHPFGVAEAFLPFVFLHFPPRIAYLSLLFLRCRICRLP